jgi:hypothetical protein
MCDSDMGIITAATWDGMFGVANDTLRGDLNHDCEVTADDGIATLQIVVGSHEHDSAANMNGNDQVTFVDSLIILQTTIGNMTS